MKNSLVNIAMLAIISILTLAACSTNTQKENMTAGAVAGAVLGGVAGSTIGAGTGQLVAIGAGAIAGGLLGAAIGGNMENADTQKINNTLDHNAVRKTSKWTNNTTGAKYTMTPMSQVMSYNGQSHCRRFHSTAAKDGEVQTAKGIACKQENGNWQVVSA